MSGADGVDALCALAPQDAVRMRAVASLRGSLDACFEAAKCVVCQDSLADAVQLVCCHMLCEVCVDHTLAKTPRDEKGRVPCPMCREPINKRGLRAAPLPIAQIVASFSRLDFLIADAEDALLHDKPPAESCPAPQSPEPPEVRTPLPISRPTSSDGTPMGKQVGSSTYPVSACALCPRGVDPSTVAPTAVMGPLQPISAAAATKSTLRVHEECGFFADGVYALNGVFVNAEKALRTAKKHLCGREACGRKGAALVCKAPDCDARFHYVCAIASACAVFMDGSYAMFCPKHRSQAPILDRNEFTLNQIEPGGSQAMQWEDICMICRKGGDLVLCGSCPRACHLICAELSSIPPGEWSCGVCTGTHEICEEWQTRAEPAAPSAQRKARRKRKSTSPPQVLQPLSLNSQSVQQFQPNERKSEEHAKPSHCKRRRRSTESMVILPTGLNADAKAMLRAAQKRHKGSFAVASDFSPRVTHVLVDAYRPDEHPRRTFKLCMGIAANLPIIAFKWVEDAVSNNVCPLPSLELYLHKVSRVGKGVGLFHGQRFYFGNFKDSKHDRETIMQVVKVGKGKVMTHEPNGATLVQGRGHIFVVKPTDDESKQSSQPQNNTRLSSQAFSELPAACEVVSPEWVLDQCMRS